MNLPEHVLSFEQVYAAKLRIGNRVRNTPLTYALNLSQLLGFELFMKLECLQVTGSFKERGAANKLLMLDPAVRAAGVVAASAGNHAQGLALHATKLGISAMVVMPERTPLVKATRTKRYGAEVLLQGQNFDESLALARKIAADEGRALVHAFDDVDIMAGQGTVAFEMFDTNSELDAIIVPIGGGGLISGIACVYKQLKPSVELIGVQTEAFPSTERSIAAHRVTNVPSSRTIADGIAVRQPGVKTFEVMERLVDRVVTVSEEDIARSILLLLEEEKVVAEGAGAVPIAALISGQLEHLRGKRIGVVISGGNIDTNLISMIIERGLVQAGRRAQIEVSIPDRPGALATLTRIISEQGANILEIRHDRTFANVSVGETDVIVQLETRGPADIVALKHRLGEEGFRVA